MCIKPKRGIRTMPYTNVCFDYKLKTKNSEALKEQTIIKFALIGTFFLVFLHNNNHYYITHDPSDNVHNHQQSLTSSAGKL